MIALYAAIVWICVDVLILWVMWRLRDRIDRSA